MTNSNNEPTVVEKNIEDSALQSLIIMATLHGIAADPAQLKHEFGNQIFNTTTVLLAAKYLNLTAKHVKQDLERLAYAPIPAIGIDENGNYFIVAKFEFEQGNDIDIKNKKISKILIQYPNSAPKILSRNDFYNIWNGELILITSKANFAGDMAKFDFSWFVPVIIKYRKFLTEVLIISIVIQLIALITPMFFQVVMDKVLVNNALKTLNVIALGLFFAVIFDVVLTGIRNYIFSHVSSKIDVELGAKLFKHLQNLPLAYFHARRVGDSVARVRELENIRSFLTGNALTLILDIAFSFIFIAVMFWYSATLTFVVLASLPFYFILSLIFTPILRNRLNEKFNRGAENQAFLVETISGIDTIKAMAVEPPWQQKWEKQLAGYVSIGLATNNIGLIANSGVNLISKLVTVIIMWMGATLVLEGKMTVGELIAFNMLSGQVSSPILRLAQLWNDFQQVGISMSRLGDILNARTEIYGQKTRIPLIMGAISFDQISFRYKPDAPEVIRDLSLNILPGEIIGIVGRSGSGKSTLTKLVQRLFVPERGRVLIDGQDLAVIDTASLRHQIGVVLQENMLFTRSIRDNIALSNPAISIENIIEAAKLAGAHDFICELSEGYDTVIGENGIGLSGGQRQRIAIARALISNPRILIFDEATSALDYESEKIIQDNMHRICKNRTVIVIAHRLSAVRDANRIVVLERGQIAEIGTHEQLLNNQNGIYSHLYSLQSNKKSNNSEASI